MKLTKSFMIIQTILMYLSQIPLICMYIIALIDKDNNLTYLLDVFGLAFRISLVIVVLIAITNIIISFLSIRKEGEDLSKFTMILKLIQIPWYILNFFFSVLVILGLMNIFFFMLPPLVTVIAMLSTYTIMISISSYEIIYLIKGLIKKNIKFSWIYLLSIIFMLIFVLDIPGSIIIYSKQKQNNKII